MQISNVRVRKIEKDEYDGPVHNLETESEHYVAEGIVVHNCPHSWSTQPNRVPRSECPILWMGG